jgi:hypothetical protein
MSNNAPYCFSKYTSAHMPLLAMLLVLFCAGLLAQTGPTPSGGPPSNPLFFSIKGAIWVGGLDDAAPDPKGVVQKLTWEQLQVLPEQANEGMVVKRRLSITYDGDGHELERRDEDPYYKLEFRTVSDWQNGRLISREYDSLQRPSVSSEPKMMPTLLRQWHYDDGGRLAEFDEHNEFSEKRYLYHYDANGRLTGSDCKKGTDASCGRTEVKYSGGKIETTTYDESGKTTGLETQNVDDNGRVVDCSSSYLKNGVLTSSYHVAFRYDAQGRVVEQTSGSYEPGSNHDYIPLPGKVLVVYDDGKHTIEWKYYDRTGKLAIHWLGESDVQGTLLALNKLDPNGKVITQSQSIFNPRSRKLEARRGSVSLEINYDDHGNWTERKRWFTPADGSSKILMRVVQQTITYR